MSNRRAPAKTVPDDQETGGSAEGSLGSSRARSVSGTTKRTAQLGEEPPKTAKVMKKQPAFNPRPVGGPSGADADQSMRLPPPPPSERKIARKRESTRAAREQEPESPPQVKRQKTSSKPTSDRARGTTPADPLLAELRADAGSNPFQATAVPRVDFLNFSNPVKGKSAAPRPSSPPRMPDLSHPRQSMGPPTGPYVRKTRKSMRGMGLDSLSAETLVPIPDGETPMIKKNKEMRNEQARRSSLGMRGQRASSSLGRGEISIPHPSVDSTLLYKHIASTLPEPHRARHLLVYCAKRTTDMSVAPVSSKSKRKAKPTDEVRSDEGDRLVSEIMEQFMTNLGKGVIETNVFAGPDRDSRAALSGLRPHPRNESNRIVKANDDAAIKRGKEQSAIWHSLVMRTNRRQAEMSEKISQKKTANSDPDMSVAPPWMREALKLANDLIAQGAGELTDKGEFADVEYKVDTLHAASHAARQYTLTASRFLDGVFSSLSADLAPAGRPAPAAASGAEGDGIETGTLLATTAASGSASTGGPAGGSSRNRPDPMAMLRALAAADAKNAPDETVAAAARLAPVVSSSAAATSSSTGGSGSSSLNVSTSRRTEAPTPRRPGVTPRRAGVLGSGTTPKR